MLIHWTQARCHYPGNIFFWPLGMYNPVVWIRFMLNGFFIESASVPPPGGSRSPGPRAREPLPGKEIQ